MCNRPSHRSTTDWAPEMRLRNSAGKRVPYNECVDWFSLGCILYEFLRGMSPFRTERAMDWCADTIQDKVRLFGNVLCSGCSLDAARLPRPPSSDGVVPALPTLLLSHLSPGKTRGQGDIGDGTGVPAKILRRLGDRPLHK